VGGDGKATAEPGVAGSCRLIGIDEKVAGAAESSQKDAFRLGASTRTYRKIDAGFSDRWHGGMSTPRGRPVLLTRAVELGLKNGSFDKPAQSELGSAWSPRWWSIRKYEESIDFVACVRADL
jgi:hypothetical protein